MIRAISYGGGVQSTALLVLAAQGEIDFPLALFCNVGDDSENPTTLRFVSEHAIPFAQAHGIEFVELQRRKRDGTPETLMQRIEQSKRSITIPMRLERGPMPRSCTRDFKINVVLKELKRRGATAENPAVTALGISLDECQRMRTSTTPEQELRYPLIDRRLDRADCMNIIAAAGLPVPPKSSCFFCPFHSMADWRRMARQSPDLFAKSVDLERRLNERLAMLGMGNGYFSHAGRPLDEAFSDDGQLDLFDDGATCDIGGYCMA